MANGARNGSLTKGLIALAAVIGITAMHSLVAMSPASAQSCGDFPHVHKVMPASDSASADIGNSEAKVMASMGVAEIPTPGEASGGAICLAILLASFVLTLIARPFSYRSRDFRLEPHSAAPSMRDRAPPSVCLSEVCVWRT